MRNSSRAGLRNASVVVTVTTASTARISTGANTPPIQMKALSERREASAPRRRPRVDAYRMKPATMT